MHKYHELVIEVLEKGERQPNRTGIDAISMPGAFVKYDLREGFPAVTTRRAPFKTALGEMIGFLRGYTSAAQFRSIGCKVWDANANENKDWLNNPFRLGADDLGPVYGAQFRNWQAFTTLPLAAGHPHAGLSEHLEEIGYSYFAESSEELVFRKSIDQVRQCLDTIMTNPADRRILFHGWNPATLHRIALPTCVTVYHFHVNQRLKQLSLNVWIRSSDLGLGYVANVMQQAFLLELFARLTGYTPTYLTTFISDAHVYVNQLGMLEEMLSREPYPLPRLKFSEDVPDYAKTGSYQPEWLDRIGLEHVKLSDDYRSHPPLTAPMAV